MDEGRLMDMSSIASATTTNPGSRLDRSVVPEKCGVGITEQAYRTWRRLVEECLASGNVKNPVQWIRLLCTSEIQQLLESRYSVRVVSSQHSGSFESSRKMRIMEKTGRTEILRSGILSALVAHVI